MSATGIDNVWPWLPVISARLEPHWLIAVPEGVPPGVPLLGVPLLGVPPLLSSPPPPHACNSRRMAPPVAAPRNPLRVIVIVIQSLLASMGCSVPGQASGSG